MFIGRSRHPPCRHGIPPPPPRHESHRRRHPGSHPRRPCCPHESRRGHHPHGSRRHPHENRRHGRLGSHRRREHHQTCREKKAPRRVRPQRERQATSKIASKKGDRTRKSESLSTRDCESATVLHSQMSRSAPRPRRGRPRSTPVCGQHAAGRRTTHIASGTLAKKTRVPSAHRPVSTAPLVVTSTNNAATPQQIRQEKGTSRQKTGTSGPTCHMRMQRDSRTRPHTRAWTPPHPARRLPPSS